MEHVRPHNLKDLSDAYLDYLLQDLPSEEEIARQQVLSDRFLRRMDDLVGKARRPIRIWKKRLLVAAIICALLASAASVYANRDAVANFIVHVYEKFTSIVFQQPTESSEPTSEPALASGLSDKLPIDMPQGYKVSDQLLLKGYIQIVYTNEAGQELLFTKQEKSGLHIGIDTEGAVIEEMAINGNRGIFYTNKGQNNLIWEDASYAYSIIGKIDKQVMIGLATSTK